MLARRSRSNVRPYSYSNNTLVNLFRIAGPTPLLFSALNSSKLQVATGTTAVLVVVVIMGVCGK